MPAFEVKIDQSSLDYAKRMLDGMPEMQKKVHYQALNNTMTKVKNDMATASEKVLTVEEKSKIKDVITINKATLNSPSADVKGTGKPIALSYFITQQTSEGMMTKVYWGTPAKLVKHAFKATAKSGHKGVFWRKKREVTKPFNPMFPYGALPKKYRLPINEIYGPSVADALKTPGTLDGVLEKADTKLQEEYNRVLDRELLKL